MAQGRGAEKTIGILTVRPLQLLLVIYNRIYRAFFERQELKTRYKTAIINEHPFN